MCEPVEEGALGDTAPPTLPVLKAESGDSILQLSITILSLKTDTYEMQVDLSSLFWRQSSARGGHTSHPLYSGSGPGR